MPLLHLHGSDSDTDTLSMRQQKSTINSQGDLLPSLPQTGASYWCHGRTWRSGSGTRGCVGIARGRAGRRGA